MSYSHSKKWVSTAQREQQRWRGIETDLRRNFPKSPFPPRTYAEWVEHQLAQRKRALQSKIHKAESLNDNQQWFYEEGFDPSRKGQGRQYLSHEGSWLGIQPRPPPPITAPLHGRTFNDGRSAVLAEPTIWQREIADVLPGREVASWPNTAEYKWEGDDRARSGVGRYLPLPRASGNDTVAWHQRPMLEPLPFDAVRKVPTMEEVYSPVEEIPTADICSLVNRGVLIAVM